MDGRMAAWHNGKISREEEEEDAVTNGCVPDVS